MALGQAGACVWRSVKGVARRARVRFPARRCRAWCAVAQHEFPQRSLIFSPHRSPAAFCPPMMSRDPFHRPSPISSSMIRPPLTVVLIIHICRLHHLHAFDNDVRSNVAWREFRTLLFRRKNGRQAKVSFMEGQGCWRVMRGANASGHAAARLAR